MLLRRRLHLFPATAASSGSKPLWEMWLIEDLEEDRFALITKTHHSLIDGIAGVDLATVLFDLAGAAAERLRPRP
jgi:hypothetical protein